MKTRPKPFLAFVSPAINKPALSPSKASPHRRRPLLPPFLRVESDGVGVTSSILPIFIPERAKARRADWAPGPGVLVPLPMCHLSGADPEYFVERDDSTSGSSDLNMERIDSHLLAPHCHILSRQHGSVWRRFITIGFDFHTTGHASDGFAATGITQNVSR